MLTLTKIIRFFKSLLRFKKLTIKLNSSDAQQEQVTGLVLSQLKSDKFSNLLVMVGDDK